MSPSFIFLRNYNISDTINIIRLSLKLIYYAHMILENKLEIVQELNEFQNFHDSSIMFNDKRGRIHAHFH